MLAGLLVLGHRRQLRPDHVLAAAQVLGHPLVSDCVGAGAASAPSPKRAVSSFLVARAMAARHARVGLPALGHHGQGRRVSAGAVVAGAGGTEPWFWIVGGAGLVTLLLGGYAAMFQNDPKGVLAYSTISTWA